MRIAALYRYPVKGLSPQAVESADLETDGYFPGDRIFAFENGASGFNPDAPEHQPKIKFLMLMRNARLAALQSHYDDENHRLSIRNEGAPVVSGDLRNAAERAAFEAFFTDYLGDEIRGPVRLLDVPDGFHFTDSKSGFVSLVNLASVAAIGEAAGADLDPLRFRANLYIAGLEAWRESDLVGRTLKVGGAELEVLKMTDRCAATGVAPGLGLRDVDVVQEIRKSFGHIDCGVYARIKRSGRIAVGDRLLLSDSASA